MSNELMSLLGQARHISGGYNSEVFVINAGVPYVAKVLGGKRLSAEKRIVLTFDQAHVLGTMIASYADRLKTVNVPLPEHFSWAVCHKGDDGASLIIFQSFVGEENAKARLMAASNSQEIVQVVRAILSAISPIFSPSVMGTVGIDPKPENFVFSNGKVKFVDFMPPRFRQGKRAIVEYPEPITDQGYKLGFWKHFTPEGILTILLIQLARIRPEYFSLFYEEICSWLRCGVGNDDWAVEVSNNLQKWLVSPNDPNGIVLAIENATNPYQLRLIICQLSDYLQQGIMEQLFKMSHYEDGDFTTILAKVTQKALAILACETSVK